MKGNICLIFEWILSCGRSHVIYVSFVDDMCLKDPLEPCGYLYNSESNTHAFLPWTMAKLQTNAHCRLCPFSIIIDSSWRVETVLLWTELCLRCWLPLLHALQTDHEGLPGCKGRSFICQSSSNLMRVPANRLCCPWEIQRHGTPPSTHPSTKLVLIKSHLPEEYEHA